MCPGDWAWSTWVSDFDTTRRAEMKYEVRAINKKETRKKDEQAHVPGFSCSCFAVFVYVEEKMKQLGMRGARPGPCN